VGRRLRVVAAVLTRASGEVLIAERPAGKPLAGRWEFPGGKVAAGESDLGALRRELTEELGIEVDASRHLMDLDYDYPVNGTGEDRPGRSLTLSTWIVERYRGEPRALEGQRLKWVTPEALADEDLLEADQPIVEALQAGAGVNRAKG
jgi:8-oxo-dGTP diphosphatase